MKRKSKKLCYKSLMKNLLISLLKINVVVSGGVLGYKTLAVNTQKNNKTVERFTFNDVKNKHLTFENIDSNTYTQGSRNFNTYSTTSDISGNSLTLSLYQRSSTPQNQYANKFSIELKAGSDGDKPGRSIFYEQYSDKAEDSSYTDEIIKNYTLEIDNIQRQFDSYNRNGSTKEYWDDIQKKLSDIQQKLDIDYAKQYDLVKKDNIVEYAEYTNLKEELKTYIATRVINPIEEEKTNTQDFIAELGHLYCKAQENNEVQNNFIKAKLQPEVLELVTKNSSHLPQNLKDINSLHDKAIGFKTFEYLIDHELGKQITVDCEDKSEATLLIPKEFQKSWMDKIVQEESNVKFLDLLKVEKQQEFLEIIQNFKLKQNNVDLVQRDTKNDDDTIEEDFEDNATQYTTNIPVDESNNFFDAGTKQSISDKIQKFYNQPQGDKILNKKKLEILTNLEYKAYYLAAELQKIKAIEFDAKGCIVNQDNNSDTTAATTRRSESFKTIFDFRAQDESSSITMSASDSASDIAYLEKHLDLSKINGGDSCSVFLSDFDITNQKEDLDLSQSSEVDSYSESTQLYQEDSTLLLDLSQSSGFLRDAWNKKIAQQFEDKLNQDQDQDLQSQQSATDSGEVYDSDFQQNELFELEYDKIDTSKNEDSTLNIYQVYTTKQEVEEENPNNLYTTRLKIGEGEEEDNSRGVTIKNISDANINLKNHNYIAQEINSNIELLGQTAIFKPSEGFAGFNFGVKAVFSSGTAVSAASSLSYFGQDFSAGLTYYAPCIKSTNTIQHIASGDLRIDLGSMFYTKSNINYNLSQNILGGKLTLGAQIPIEYNLKLISEINILHKKSLGHLGLDFSGSSYNTEMLINLNKNKSVELILNSNVDMGHATFSFGGSFGSLSCGFLAVNFKV